MTKVRVPTCGTCGHEDTVEVDPDQLVEKIQRLKGEEAALLKLLDKGPPGEDEASYRRKTLERLIDKTRSQLIEAERILAILD